MARAEQEPEDLDGAEADVSDVIEQAEPEGSEPVGEALAERDRLVPGDPEEDEREREDAREADGGA